jgi:hypothetical protein
MLGLILVEVLLGKDVFQNEGADVVSPGTLENALAALDTIRLDWGPSCSDAIKRCLLSFGRDVDCKNEQRPFVDGVLRPLEDLSREFLPGRSVPWAKRLVLVRNWDRARNASKDNPFPLGLTEEYIETSDLTDRTPLRVFRDYAQAILEACESIRWLNEAFSNEGLPLSVCRKCCACC